MAIKCKAIKEIEKGLSNKDTPLKYDVSKSIISIWVKNKDKFLQGLEAPGKVIQEVTLINWIMSFFVCLFVKGAKIFQSMEC